MGKNWNDFGFKTDCGIRIFGLDTPIEFEGKVAFKSMQTSGYEYFKRKLESLCEHDKLFQPFLTNNELPDFYTMLLSIESYRHLIRKIGLDTAGAILRSLHDMAFAKATRSKALWFVDAQRERAFTESFIRTSEAFFAFNNASFLVDGLEEERLDAVSSQLKLSFQLDNFQSP